MTVPCYPCRHLIESVQDGRKVDICLFWRRKAGDRCREYEVGARMRNPAAWLPPDHFQPSTMRIDR